MKEKLKISIVTPSYNQGDYIEKTIDSVLSQGYENLEYFIIDGGSSDNSVEIIKKYEKHLTYWVSEKDKGQADALNKGFSQATGDIFAYINSDDLYVKNTFNKINNEFQADPNIEILYGDYFLLFNDDSLIAKPKISWDFDVALYSFLMIMQPASFWSKNIHQKINGFRDDLFFILDYDFFMRAAHELKSNPSSIKHIKDYYAYFRIHDESITGSGQKGFKKEGKELRKQFSSIDSIMINNMKKYYYLLKAVRMFYKERGFIPLKADFKKNY